MEISTLDKRFLKDMLTSRLKKYLQPEKKLNKSNRQLKSL